MQGQLNNSKFLILFKGPGIKDSGVFYLEESIMQTDYSKLNDRIVRQAYEVSNLVLSNDMKVRLFENKIRRAAEMIRAREASPAKFVQDGF
jgi:hypothetical protein